MSLLFLSNGILNTLQDAGRNGSRASGINPNGAMDKRALRLINILLGNDENEGALELHFPAPKILFEENAFVALGGADFNAKLNEQLVENWRAVAVKKGDVLSFPQKNKGERIYLAIRGGFEVEKQLGSVSTNLTAGFGGFNGRGLQKGDRLFFSLKFKAQSEKFKSNYKISRSLLPLYSNFPTVRVTAGAEWRILNVESQKSFLQNSFKIRRESDRMGFRLQSEPLELKEKLELVSSAVDFGTIQLLPDGQLIILMADHQTTGGYPRVAHIIKADLPLIAQVGAGNKLNFEIISLETAENLSVQFEKELNWLKIGCLLRGK